MLGKVYLVEVLLLMRSIGMMVVMVVTQVAVVGLRLLTVQEASVSARQESVEAPTVHHYCLEQQGRTTSQHQTREDMRQETAPERARQPAGMS